MQTITPTIHGCNTLPPEVPLSKTSFTPCFLNRKKHKTTRDFPPLFCICVYLRKWKEAEGSFFYFFPTSKWCSSKTIFHLGSLRCQSTLHKGTISVFPASQKLVVDPSKTQGRFRARTTINMSEKAPKNHPKSKKSVNDQIPKIQVKKLISCTLGIQHIREEISSKGRMTSVTSRQRTAVLLKFFWSNSKSSQQSFFHPLFLLFPSVSI